MKGLRLLDENHVTRIADDDLARSRDGPAHLRRAHRAAYEIFIAGDHQRRSCDSGDPGAKVETRDLLPENSEGIAVYCFGAERVQVACLGGAESRKVKRHLPESKASPLCAWPFVHRVMPAARRQGIGKPRRRR